MYDSGTPQTRDMFFLKKAENVKDWVALLYPVLTRRFVFNKYFFFNYITGD